MKDTGISTVGILYAIEILAEEIYTGTMCKGEITIRFSTIQQLSITPLLTDDAMQLMWLGHQKIMFKELQEEISIG
jgi:hypothetical protein